MKKVRCAIYTRKSSEEGLEQDFNSLDAQREACAAYVLSQASEGWTLVPEHYDDGGLSGGTLERPALQRLLREVEAGKIDIIVVYKVDRLTRSLLDFARLVEALDKAGTSFVSVTQSFNTTTSMGRLTLNMLLSFAQFEREVTAERIRDKIAASKAKGMWMGGVPPLGYQPDGRSLTIIEEHAELVRHIYRRYLAIDNVRLLAERLSTEGIVVPRRITGTGRSIGGGVFTRGQIYKLLSNPIYIGEIPHRDVTYPGNHPAIIERDLWDQVQARLADNTQGKERSTQIKSPSPLAGRVFDEAGGPLVAAHAVKRQRRYRYYVGRSLQHDANMPPSRSIRVPALELERTVGEAIAKLFDDPLDLVRRAALDPRPDQIAELATNATAIAARLRKGSHRYWAMLAGKVTVAPDRIVLDMPVSVIAEVLRVQPSPISNPNIAITIDASIKRSGLAVRLVHDSGAPAVPSQPQDHLVRLISKARAWWRELVESDLNATDLAIRKGVSRSYACRVMRLNFLAPRIAEAILEGRQPLDLDAGRLVGLHDLPLGWSEQSAMLGIA